MTRRRCLLVLAVLLTVTWHSDAEEPVPVGVAAVDITPDYPIRLSGYGNRRTESEGVAQKIWAKALAIGDQSPVILVTVDNCGVPQSLTEEVARRLNEKAGIERARFSLCSSHSHTAPCLSGVLPLLFGMPISSDEQATIDRYTRELTDHIEQVCLEALKARQPARMTWSQGTVDFAANRRTKGGPVDHSLPTLFVWSPDNKLRAVLVNYACHCTTLGGEFNQICGDWSGYAQEAIQKRHPEAVALVAIGCGADANPNLRLQLSHAVRHGDVIAEEVDRLLAQPQRPLPGDVQCKMTRIELPFEEPPDEQGWQQRSQSDFQALAFHATTQLQKLKQGKTLQKALDYPVQTWTFGDDLAMVFLAGEVVVDYSLRLKTLYDADRIWVNAYSNDVPCYIPSKRVLREGGYEAETSMIYYDRPARLQPIVEDRIVETVQKLLPEGFRKR